MCLQSFNRIISLKSIQRSITLKHSEKYYYSHYPGVWRHRDLSYHLSNACHIIQSSKVYWLSISSIPVKPIIFFPQKMYSFAHSYVYPALSHPFPGLLICSLTWDGGTGELLLMERTQVFLSKQWIVHEGAGEGQVWGAAKQAVWRDEKKVALGVFQYPDTSGVSSACRRLEVISKWVLLLSLFPLSWAF